MPYRASGGLEREAEEQASEIGFVPIIPSSFRINGQGEFVKQIIRFFSFGGNGACGEFFHLQRNSFNVFRSNFISVDSIDSLEFAGRPAFPGFAVRLEKNLRKGKKSSLVLPSKKA